jgi:uncharacterized protein YjiS (DUF1127 family)
MNHSATFGNSAVVDARRSALRLVEWMNRIDETVKTWHRRYRTRRQFALVDPRILKDCGISEASQFIEVNKPFWEA